MLISQIASRTHTQILHNFQSMLSCRVVDFTRLLCIPSHLLQYCFLTLSSPKKREKLIPFTQFLGSSKVRKLLNPPTSIHSSKQEKGKERKSPLKFVAANQLHGFLLLMPNILCVLHFFTPFCFPLVLNYCLSTFNDFFFLSVLLLAYRPMTQSTLSI